MISKCHVSETYELVCDECGEYADEAFDEFMDAVDYRKANGWRCRKINEEWVDCCPDCLKKKVKKL